MIEKRPKSPPIAAFKPRNIATRYKRFDSELLQRRRFVRYRWCSYGWLHGCSACFTALTSILTEKNFAPHCRRSTKAFQYGKCIAQTVHGLLNAWLIPAARNWTKWPQKSLKRVLTVASRRFTLRAALSVITSYILAARMSCALVHTSLRSSFTHHEHRGQPLFSTQWQEQ